MRPSSAIWSCALAATFCATLFTSTLAAQDTPVAQAASSASYRCATLPQGSRSRLQACRDAVAADSLDLAASYQLGQQLYETFQEDSLHRSLALWERVIRYKPQDTTAHYALAYGYLKQRRYGLAATEARRALALDRNFPQAMAVLQAANRRFIGFGPIIVPDSLIDEKTLSALDHLEHGHWLLKHHPLDSALAERAGDEFRAAIVLLPTTDPRGYTGLSAALRTLERYPEARAAIDTAIQRDTTSALAFQERNKLYFALGHRDSVQIAAQAFYGRHGNRSRERGTVIVQRVTPSATVRAGNRSITTLVAPTITDNAASGDPLTVIRFAEAMAQSSYPEDGVLIIRQLARIYPDRADIWGRVAWVNFDARRYIEAAAAWAKAAELDAKYFDSRPFEKRDRDIAISIAGKQRPMTVKDLDRPL